MKFVNEDKSWLEWLVFGLSTILIMVLLVYLIIDARKDQERPPELKIKIGQAVSSTHGYLVPVTVTNSGDQTAQAVELEISAPGEAAEKATLSYDFLSSGELREGWVGFSGKPGGELKARVVGYRTE